MKRWLAWGAGAVVFAAALLVALLPVLIDAPAARAEIQRRLAQALGGEMSWESLEIGLFPPRGELRKLRVEIPGKLVAATEEVQVHLRFWPLLLGSVQVSSVSLRKSVVRIVPAEGTGKSEPPPDAVALYRAAIGPAAQVLQDFAPDMAFRLTGAEIDVAPFALRDLDASLSTNSTGFDLELAAASNFWKRLSMSARVAYADLSARASVELDALALDQDVPAAALRVKMRTDAKSAVEYEFDGSVGALAPQAKGRLVLPAGKPPELAVELSRVDLAQALALARRKGVALDVIESAEGKVSFRANASLGSEWRAHFDILKSDAAVKLAPLPWVLAAHAAQVTVTQRQVRVAGGRGTLGKSAYSDVTLQIDLDQPARLSAASGRATLELGQWLPWLKARLPLEDIASLSGGVDVALHRLALRFDRPAALDFDAVATPREVSAVLKALPAPLSVTGGSVRAGPSQVRLENLRGAVGNSAFSEVAAQIDLGKAARISSASGRATLELEQWFPWLKARLPLGEVASLTGSVDVALRRLALPFDRPEALDFDLLATPRKVSAALTALPAPISVTGGSVRAAPEGATYQGVAVALLDARVVLSGTVATREPALELSLAEGVAGESLVRWALERLGIPVRLEPRTPLRFAAKRLAWTPQGGLETDARVAFEGGPEVGLAAAWRPGLLELRRAAIKDARSDAVLGATVRAERIDARFSGTLHGRSIAAMLRSPPPGGDAGMAQGELEITIDRARPANSVADGRLRIDALDLTWLAGRKALVERVDLVVEPAGLRIAEARFNVEDQVVGLRGNIRRSEQGPIIEAAIESPGIVLDRLLPAPDPGAPAAKEPAIWPLPVSGRIEVRSGFVQYQHHRIEPFEASLTLEPRRARLEVQQARMCGVSFPLEVEAVPESLTAAAHIRMKDEPLEAAMHCLTSGRVAITGNIDLSAELRTRGRRPDLVRNLTGTAQAEVRDGRVKKFALIGNILSMRNIASVEHLKADGFPYRSMSTRGRFEGGAFVVEEGMFDSDAVRLAVNGRVDLLGADTRLAVLVGLLARVERVVGAIPFLGDVLGGALTSVPVSVRGDIRDPLVVPLDPRAITNELLGIFERTLKLPGKLVLPPEAKP